jgi:hypothetical protein
METLSRSKPVLMIFEDVHWIDPTSLEALGRAVDRTTALGVLLIVTYRPEFEPPGIGRPHVAAIAVNRLGQREIAAMIAQRGLTGSAGPRRWRRSGRRSGASFRTHCWLSGKRRQAHDALPALAAYDRAMRCCSNSRRCCQSSLAAQAVLKPPLTARP